jgi:hypothetical protein
LGYNDNRAEQGQGEQLVLLVRGDLFKKYPDTLVYAVPAVVTDWGRAPALEEFLVDGAAESATRILPVFEGSLPPDLTFFGFPFSAAEARGRAEDGEDEARFPRGIFLVLEERVSEARFGLDEGSRSDTPIQSWDELAWGHFDQFPIPDDASLAKLAPGQYVDARSPQPVKTELSPSWDDSSASIARITLQKPVRIAVHADQMIPDLLVPG